MLAIWSVCVVMYYISMTLYLILTPPITVDMNVLIHQDSGVYTGILALSMTGCGSTYWHTQQPPVVSVIQPMMYTGIHVYGYMYMYKLYVPFPVLPLNIRSLL